MKKGFTLVELLVVISIIATLTAILLPNFMGARERAKDAQKIQDLNAVKNALRLYYNDNQGYPLFTDCTSCLTAPLGVYLTNVAQIGYTYTSITGDTFILKTGLEVGTGDEDIGSQAKCGVGVTADKVFMVCAN